MSRKKTMTAIQKENKLTVIESIHAQVKANVPSLWIKTNEEERFIQDLLVELEFGIHQGLYFTEISNSKIQVFVWSITQGLHEINEEFALDELPKRPVDEESQDLDWVFNNILEPNNSRSTKIKRRIFFFRDIHPIMEKDVMSRRKFLDIRSYLYRTEDKETRVVPTTCVFMGNSSEIPLDLSNQVKFFDFPYLTKNQIKERIKVTLEQIEQSIDIKDKNGIKYSADKEKITYNEQELEEISGAMAGQTAPEIIDQMNYVLTNYKVLDREVISKAKRALLARSEILEVEDCNDTMADVGGLDQIKEWLKFKELAGTKFGKSAGIEHPNGILCLGIQGGGKSLIGRVTAGYFKLPLVRLDVGRIFAGLVGQSESNMREMIKQIESLGRAVLFIDEIEKGFSGTASSNSSDSGTTSRIFGTFITWMNDKRNEGHPGNGIIVVGTANSIDQLPPEFLRKGRFDEIWFFDLPTPSEAAQIFKIHVRKKNLPIQGEINYEELGKIKHKNKYLYSGAEIEQALIESRSTALARMHPNLSKINRESECINFGIRQEDIVNALEAIVPLSVTMEKNIKKLRKFGQERCRVASSKVEADTERFEIGNDQEKTELEL